MTTLKPVAKSRLNSAFKQLMSLHWVMSACYLVLFIGGTFMAQLPRELLIRGPLYDFHKSVGVLTMALLTLRILTLLRVGWKKYTKRLPKFTKEWYKKLALHGTLYVFMWLVPVAGFFFSNSFKSNNVKFLGIVLPDVFPQNSAMVEVGRSLHFWLAYTFLALAILHILAQQKVVRANWRRLTNFVRTKLA
ncbi:MAG: cytochrome b/b6 domain-containing protein [Microcoleus sp. CAN_BIN18]|nr:cytochrome b/b6 domain-containing protein [Microcoleus sp. CAN_BIN18]